MKRVPPFLMSVFVATVVFFSANSTNAAPATKVNVDSKGVILKGYDAVAYFTQGKPVKGNPAIKSTHGGATYLFASAENKAALTRILPSMCRSMADFVPLGFLSECWPTSKDRADLSTTANCTSAEMRLRAKVLEVTSRGISPKPMRTGRS